MLLAGTAIERRRSRETRHRDPVVSGVEAAAMVVEQALVILEHPLPRASRALDTSLQGLAARLDGETVVNSVSFNAFIIRRIIICHFLVVGSVAQAGVRVH